MIKKLHLSKKYLILGIIIVIIVIAIFVQTAISPNTSQPIVPQTPTPSQTIITPEVNFAESTVEWNSAIQKDLEEYKKTDKPRIDEALAVVRMNSPVTQPNFFVEYSYRTATYTIYLQQPEEESKASALLWFASLGVSEKDLESLRLEWITQP